MSGWTDEELAALEDPDYWDEDSTIVLPGIKNPHAVLQIRVNRAELHDLQSAADKAGLSLI